ncbi:MAG: aldehyde ferredoxin oxidoreductase family protein [Actinomycetota bacterium]|nr:aldehyde ferredoxin oxidoreductase family protein [Actinomycetota bacterium]
MGSGGWVGRVLRLDLSDQSSRVDELDLQRAASYIGGRGLAAAYLIDEADPAADPFDPATPLIFATGPLTGTNASCGARYMVVTKGPLTGCITTSNSGGHWGPELKFAGYDLLIVTGRASSPVYVSIEDDEVTFVPASHLWGKGVWDTEDSIREELGSSEVKISSIGPAGENLVRFAAVMNDKHRAAGRSGVGAVMGSKNLKAIAVRGTGKVELDDAAAFIQAMWEKKESLQGSRGRQMFTSFGTSMTISPVNGVGALPTRNFQETVFEGTEKISGELINDRYVVANKACFACTIACGRVAKISTGAGDRFALRTSPRNWREAGEGPEYESMYGFGPDVGVDDPEVLIAGHWLCNDYGMDPISCGATIAAAMELNQEGLIDPSAGSLDWGDGERLLQLIEMTAFRRGIGDELAEGSKRMTAKYGRPELAMVSKGQEFAAYDGRSLKGRGLSYATSNRGACHLKAETLRDDFKNTEIEGKGKMVANSENEVSSLDSTGLCLFLTSGANKEHFRTELNAATGLSLSEQDYVSAGERIWNTERLFNLSAGITPADDTLPKRMLEEPIPSGPRAGMVSELDIMLAEYYQARDWPDGIPSNERLAALGIDSLAP